MKFARLPFFLIVLGICIEIALRFSGIGNFPIYETDPQIGYIPAPNQSGNFLQKNKWVLNDKSMGVEESFKNSDGVDLLVIGDSLVYGGNPYPQEAKLGPQLQKRLGKGFKVWPIGAPSWGYLNEQEYLDRHPEVLKELEGITWVFNSGDFQERSQWRTDATHPRSRPFYLSYYVLNKYLLEGNLQPSFPHLFFWVLPPPTPSTNRIDQEFETFKTRIQELQKYALKEKLIVLYPDQSEEESPRNDFYEALSARLEEVTKQEQWSFLDMRKSSVWNKKYYRDFIHPTPEGNEKMADEVVQALDQNN